LVSRVSKYDQHNQKQTGTTYQDGLDHLPAGEINISLFLMLISLDSSSYRLTARELSGRADEAEHACVRGEAAMVRSNDLFAGAARRRQGVRQLPFRSRRAAPRTIRIHGTKAAQRADCGPLE
jgi:hypothetical protein